MDIKITCHSCSKESTFLDSISRRDECEYCHADTRCCKNCAFYDKASYNECRETSAEVETDKEKANYCDFFKAGNNKGSGEEKEDLLSAAEALFKK